MRKGKEEAKMKMNTSLDLTNINYLRYMQEQDKKRSGSNDDNGGNKNTTWRESRPRISENRKEKYFYPEIYPADRF